jgi:hypothetical protein
VVASVRPLERAPVEEDGAFLARGARDRDAEDLLACDLEHLHGVVREQVEVHPLGVVEPVPGQLLHAGDVGDPVRDKMTRGVLLDTEQDHAAVGVRHRGVRCEERCR